MAEKQGFIPMCMYCGQSMFGDRNFETLEAANGYAISKYNSAIAI